MYGIGAPRFALVEIPPYAPDKAIAGTAAAPWVSGRLSDAYDWSVAVPVVCLLRDGTVVGSKIGKDAEAALHGDFLTAGLRAAGGATCESLPCALAAMYTVSKLAGMPHSLGAIRGMFPNLVHDCSMLDLKRAAERAGFEVESRRGAWESLLCPDKIGRYAILHVDGNHFVATVPMPRGGTICVSDPLLGVREYREKDFRKVYRWPGAMLRLTDPNNDE